MSIVKQKLDWIAEFQTRLLTRIMENGYIFERFPRDIVKQPPSGDSERWEALAFAEYNDGIQVAATALVIGELLKVQNDCCTKALRRAKLAIEDGIYNEDGLDGALGQDVLLEIAAAQSALEDAL